MYTESKLESIELINQIIKNKGGQELNEDELIDWCLSENGNEITDLKEWTNDYLSECHTVRCENKNSYLYNN